MEAEAAEQLVLCSGTRREATRVVIFFRAAALYIISSRACVCVCVCV